MLNFLRKFRRNNMNSKYFKYAIGEILLVVVGILIALSINNWNEKRKDRVIEDQILDEMLISLENDLQMFKMLEKRLQRKDSAIQLLIGYREKGEIPTGRNFGSLIDLARQSISLTYDSSPYEALLSLGINKMSDKALFNDINEYYNRYAPRSLRFVENIQEELDPIRSEAEETAVKNELLDRIFIRGENNKWRISYRSSPRRLLNDKSFYQSIVIEFQYMQACLERIQRFIEYNQDLITALKK